MGRNKAIFTMGAQEHVVLGLIGEKKTIGEIKKICSNFGKGSVDWIKNKMLETGLIERVNRGEFKLTKTGKYFLEFTNKVIARKETK